MEKFVDKASIDKLAVFMDFVRDFATREAASIESLQKIELAVEEALVNIINYAYSDKKGEVEVICDKQDNAFHFTLIDSGESFDVLQKEDPDTSLSIEEREIGGLGIFLVKQMMDKTEYQRKNNKNILTLIKYN